jgi:predicted PurR-regulated permease PerM
MAPLLHTPLIPFLVILVVVVCLRLAQPVLLPLAVAVLLSVVLAPLVRRVERLRIGRILSVLVVSFGVTALMVGMGWVIANQGAELVTRLPEYRGTAENKIASLRSSLLQVEQAADRVREIEREMSEASRGAEPPPQTSRGGEPPPQKVEVVKETLEPLALVREYGGSVFAPLASLGLILVLLIFLLLQREDLRDRLIRLMGARDLHLTTVAMDDATQRVTRYLRSYALLNSGHGLVVGIGLWSFGLPAAFLFGLLSALLRFVPYLGPWVAAILPVALSFVVFDGWVTTLGIVGFLVAVELVSNNAVEPWLYGSRVGLSPFAVILSAVFWAWLWGPVGLILATPLTVCLVVLGRHAAPLRFLYILLSDEPALDPPARLYQRLLARDVDDATDLLAEYAEAHGRAASWDEVLVPALVLLENDRRRGLLGEEPLELACETLEMLVVSAPSPREEPRADPVSPEAALSSRVLCLPTRDHGDEILCLLLADVLEAGGLVCRTSRRVLLGEMVERAVAEDVDLLCVSALTVEGRRVVRHLTRRIVARRPDLDIVLGVWGAPEPVLKRLREQIGSLPRVRVVESLAEAQQLLSQLAGARRTRTQPPPVALPERAAPSVQA